LVKITYLRHPFQRDYQQKWTEELFIIRHRFLREGIPVYQIKDVEDGNIDGTFYQQELQKVNEDEDKAWTIEQKTETSRCGTGLSKLVRMAKKI
jgi:hypothetical protein